MNNSEQNPAAGLSYRDAGVDIDAGERLVDRIKPIAARTRRPGILGGIGGFGALFEVPLDRYRQPVLVSGTDGVGTKLKLAMELGKHDTIGIDLVAMCVNDIVVQGAEPLFFLDYYATGKLDVDTAAAVVSGIGHGCDLAGFCVGVVEKDKIIDGSRVQPGDALLGLASSGPHSNGYSLIRKVIAVSGADLQQAFHGRSLGDTLLEPTRIYVKSLLALLGEMPVSALAHITGGGIVENLPRVLPDECGAIIDTRSWQRPPVFDWLQDAGGGAKKEMYRTFNCGIGMIVCVPAARADGAMQLLREQGETVWRIGEITQRGGEQDPVILRDS